MSSEFFIRFDANVGANVDASTETASWLRLAADGSIAAMGHGPVTEIREAAAGYHAVVVIPAEDVLLCRAAVPAGHGRRLLAQAVPYALEDQLAADVETLHFAFGQIVNGEVAVAAADRALMDKWMARLRDAGLHPYALVPETLLLPWQEGAWQLACWGSRCLLRTGEQSGIAMDTANIDVLVRQALTEVGEAQPQHFVIYATQDTQLPLDNLALEIDRQPLPASLLPWLAGHYDERLTINLLQGAYSRRQRLGQYWRPWRVALSLVGVLLLLQVGVTVVDYQRLSSERGALQEQIEAVYRQAFPEARKVVNPKAQMENALKALRGGAGGGLSELLALGGQEFKSSPGLELQRLSYREGQLDVALTVADLQRLDELKQRLTQSGKLHVEIQSASAQGMVVEARLRIRLENSRGRSS